MRITTTGDGNLAHAIQTCCAQHFSVVSLFATDLDLLWICYDTPIDMGVPQVERVLGWIRQDVEYMTFTTPVLISSQLPVGTIATLEREFPSHRLAYSPENIRVTSGVEDFARQARVVVGRRHTQDDNLWAQLFQPFTSRLILTDPETAEMVKHALNAYLGLSIAFMHEIGRVARAVGADINTISTSLLTERRISPNAPLHPDPSWGGLHLARDISMLRSIASCYGVAIPVLDHIHISQEVEE